MNNVSFLLVTCCLEDSRTNLLQYVIENIQKEAPEIISNLTIIDNASTDPDAIELLRNTFKNVYFFNRNVGYWTAINWWLKHIEPSQPKFTYIIESDMIHYDFIKFKSCVEFLEKNEDVGSVRLHEYSVKNYHLYNKDRPTSESKKGLWQSHTNKITGNKIEFLCEQNNIWTTTFLTQLPAINRYEALHQVFLELQNRKNFTEIDFQKLYWEKYKKTGILDGGLFHCNLNPYGSKGITGSWTNASELAKIGYQTTRISTIMPSDQYIVTRTE